MARLKIVQDVINEDFDMQKLALERNKYSDDQLSDTLKIFSERTEARFNRIQHEKIKQESGSDMVKRMQETFDENYERVTKNVGQQISAINAQFIDYVAKTDTLNTTNQAKTDKMTRMYAGLSSDVSRLMAQDQVSLDIYKQWVEEEMAVFRQDMLTKFEPKTAKRWFDSTRVSCD